VLREALAQPGDAEGFGNKFAIDSDGLSRLKIVFFF